jgi:hypothetical protein
MNDDYYAPPAIRRELEAVMATVGARADNSLLHGFSRGAANLYGIVALDAGTPRPLFRQVIANAGGMSPDFPMNRDVEHGRFGRTPYAGTRWWLYCGAGDQQPRARRLPRHAPQPDVAEGKGRHRRVEPKTPAATTAAFIAGARTSSARSTGYFGGR